MRIRLRHDLHFSWDRPVRSVLQSLRITPRDHEAQHIGHWHIRTDVDCRLSNGEDAFGNLTHTCDADGPLESLTISIDGLVFTTDMAGVVRQSVERFVPELYLRDTPASATDPDLRAFALKIVPKPKDKLEIMHDLMGAVHERLKVNLDGEDSTAAAAFAAKSANAADTSHVLIALARHLEIPARYVSGYLIEDGAAIPHGWMEAHTGEIGWVGFDATLDLCPQESHLRVAIGLDALGARAVRCAPSSFAAETMTSKIMLREPAKAAASQQQSQTQS